MILVFFVISSANENVEVMEFRIPYKTTEEQCCLPPIRAKRELPRNVAGKNLLSKIIVLRLAMKCEVDPRAYFVSDYDPYSVRLENTCITCSH
ncbi:hypothetical protein SLA2020_212300 [Shorea laevis]